MRIPREGNVLKSHHRNPNGSAVRFARAPVRPWVSELRSIWRRVARTRNGRACIVELNDVTFIDRARQALARHVKGGCAIHTNGLYTKHVLEGLK